MAASLLHADPLTPPHEPKLACADPIISGRIALDSICKEGYAKRYVHVVDRQTRSVERISTACFFGMEAYPTNQADEVSHLNQ